MRIKKLNFKHFLELLKEQYKLVTKIDFRRTN